MPQPSRVLLALLLLSAAARAQTPALVGAWDLTLQTPHGDRPSWVRITSTDGKPEVLMVGFVSHATPARAVSLHGGTIEFTASKDDFGFPADMLFRGTLSAHQLRGTATDAAGDHWRWHAIRSPALKHPDPARPTRWGSPIQLFNGKDLTGWRLRDAAQSAAATSTTLQNWTVDDGVLRTSRRGSDLISSGVFGDFRLHLEFMCGPNSNTGVYLRGRYEVQIETDSVAEPPSHHTGGVYGFLAPTPEQPRVAGVWQTLDITLIGRDLLVVQNGVTVLDHRTIPGITGGALDSHEGRPGPIMLQGSEDGEVHFRNITITPALR